MADEPRDEQIAQAIVQRLRSLTAGTTYWYTPGEVERDWRMYDEVRRWPWYGVLDGELVRAQGTYRDVSVTASYTIAVWVRAEKDRRTVLARCCADIIRAVYTDETWGGLAMRTRVTRRVTDDGAAVARPYAYAEVQLEVDYYLPTGGV
jgi:hypothetical protein